MALGMGGAFGMFGMFSRRAPSSGGGVPANAMLWPDGSVMYWPDGSVMLWPS